MSTLDDVESAIARVLAAEAAATQAVQASQLEAQRRLESARAGARRVAEHAGERLQRLTLRIEAECARQVASLSTPLTMASDGHAHDAELLANVVDAVAAELSGAAR